VGVSSNDIGIVSDAGVGVGSVSIRGVSGMYVPPPAPCVVPPPVPLGSVAGVESRSLTLPPNDLRAVARGANSVKPLVPVVAGGAGV
jgi:hypothetical protein